MELGTLAGMGVPPVEDAVAIARRMWSRDHTVWDDDSTEITDRLGWLDAPSRARGHAGPMRELADEIAGDGVTDALLVGMGGSSLYPQVLRDTVDAVPDAIRLHVLDSTDPAAVADRIEGLPWERTILVPASKSGTTIETLSHLAAFEEVLEQQVGDDAPQSIVPVTDPGSALEKRAASRGYRAVVHGDADVGGRFSALTAFGLWPATLLGIAPDEHAAAAVSTLSNARSTDPAINTPAALGAVLAAAATSGRDKLTVLLPPPLASFGLWIEQLVAESTGKRGRGIVPILGETPANAAFGDDRIVVAYGCEEDVDALTDRGVPVVALPRITAADLPAEIARWEVATAVVGAFLGINPFDQPDVARAKAATSRMLESSAPLPPVLDPADELDGLAPGDYVALLGFVTPGGDDEAQLRHAADRLRQRYEVPVTVGIGPRYLHSTGQLHKGGPDTGIYLVVVGEDDQDVEIPGQGYGFAALKRAQAAGDLAALLEVGRRALHVDLEHLDES